MSRYFSQALESTSLIRSALELSPRQLHCQTGELFRAPGEKLETGKGVISILEWAHALDLSGGIGRVIALPFRKLDECQWVANEYRRPGINTRLKGWTGKGDAPQFDLEVRPSTWTAAQSPQVNPDARMHRYFFADDSVWRQDFLRGRVYVSSHQLAWWCYSMFGISLSWDLLGRDFYDVDPEWDAAKFKFIATLPVTDFGIRNVDAVPDLLSTLCKVPYRHEFEARALIIDQRLIAAGATPPKREPHNPRLRGPRIRRTP